MAKSKAKRVIGPRDVLKQPRIDGYENLVTLLGTSADKRTATTLNWDHHSPEFYEEMYAGGGIPARIVDLIPDEALREWVEWQNVENDQKEMIEDRCEELDVRGALLKSWTWARAYGGGCLFIVTDTSDPTQPLRRGENVIGLRDLSRWDLRILTTDIEYDFAKPNFGRPNLYYLNVQMGSQYKGYPIHWTRMIRFDGQLVPRRTYIRNNYWHDSILNRLWPVIRDYEISNDAAAACLQDFNVDVFKMKQLAALVASGKEGVVRTRMELIQYAKSVLNMMLIDADTEEYENKGRSLEGVAELLGMQANRLVAQTDIPHTKLLGESPDGSNATGNSTSQNWYNFIGSEQTNYLRPKMKRLFSVLFPEIPRLGFKYRPLRKLDALEEADLRQKQSVTDKNYVDAQVLDPSEIAESRFGGEEYSTDTKLDTEARAMGLIGPAAEAPIQVDPLTGEPIAPDPTAQGGGAVPGGSAPPVPGKPPIPGAPKAGIAAGGKPAPAVPGNPLAKPPGKAPLAAPGGLQGAKPALGQPKAPGQPVPPLNRTPGKGAPGVKGATALEATPGHGDPDQAHEPGIAGGEFATRNTETPKAKNPKPAVENFIGPVEGLPIRDPKTDPKIKGPGIPNKARTILPTRGTGLTAPSGSDPAQDKNVTPETDGVTPSERPQKQELPPLYQAVAGKKKDSGESVFMERGLDQVKGKRDRGVEATMKEFAKGTLKSGSGHKVTDPKQAAAIGYAEQRGDSDTRAATIIVRKGDHFLMGKRRDTGRFALPGGHVEKGESHHQGAVRELAEETGLIAKRLKFLGGRMVEPTQGKNVHVNIYQHLADDDARVTSKLDPDKEFSEFRWVPVKGPLPEDIANNLAHPNNVALAHLGLL